MEDITLTETQLIWILGTGGRPVCSVIPRGGATSSCFRLNLRRVCIAASAYTGPTVKGHCSAHSESL